MLRLLLEWYSGRPKSAESKPLPTGFPWYSEARLPSAFLPRYRGDKMSESHTHADGVIGEFRVGRDTLSELDVDGSSSTLVVIEAKMFSPLSARTTNAPNYDQAARTVACIAEILKRASHPAHKMSRLGFCVVAPQEQIDAGTFGELVTKASIRSTVESRVNGYDEPKDGWFEEWFVPVMEIIDVRLLSWESLLQPLQSADKQGHEELTDFYKRCLSSNRPQSLESAG